LWLVVGVQVELLLARMESMVLVQVLVRLPLLVDWVGKHHLTFLQMVVVVMVEVVGVQVE
jgi:uncharacterized membrane protein